MKRARAGSGVLAAVWTFAAGSAEPSLQDLAQAVDQAATSTRITIYPAREIVTLDPARPHATAVAVQNGRIVGVGSPDQLKQASSGKPYVVDTSFADQVVVPGFIAQHDHPLLAALTMTSAIIAIEDWVLPQGTSPAAKNHADYLRRLAAAAAGMKDPDAVLLTWGYHHYFHGALQKAELDAISTTRPVIVWHRSAHEFYLNSAAERRFGITREWYESLSEMQKKQSNFANAHYSEQGWFAILPKVAPGIASPDRIRAGLEFVEQYFHANGVTLGCEPGGIASKGAQDLQNSVMSSAANPLRWYFIADGKSITAAHPDNEVGSATEQLLGWAAA